MRDQAVVDDLSPTGALRVSINLGNPVLARGTADDPAGVTVDIAREIGARLGVPVEWLCFDAARKSFAALTSGRADVGFLAVEPARAADVSFTAPYVLIEGVYAVPVDSPITTADTVDRPGVRVGVKHGSAYDLYLTRILQHAELVRGAEGVDIFRDKGLEVAAGIRQPLSRHVVADPELRLVEPRFMEIRQAVATTKDRSAATLQWPHALVEELKSSGFVGRGLARSGQDASVAPPE